MQEFYPCILMKKQNKGSFGGPYFACLNVRIFTSTRILVLALATLTPLACHLLTLL